MSRYDQWLWRATTYSALALLCAALTATYAAAQPAPTQPAAEQLPSVLLLDPVGLNTARAAAQAHDPAIQSAFAALRAQADHAMGEGPFSVVAKTQPPPSGDVHDYTSLSIYWWPDGSGGPYVQRDGERNPEADDPTRYDAAALGRMVSDVETLSLAYYLTGDSTYAQHAADLLHVWFVDAATRMNPNFRFAQIIPGHDAVRGIGIIESRVFTRVVDSVGLLDGCPCWSAADRQAVHDWFGAYLSWLRDSENGKLEAAAENNHGVWYDVQLADFALFSGHSELVRQVASSAVERRIAPQIAADGSMPRELARTRSYHYSNFNLEAFAQLATLADHGGVDLWHAQAENGASLRAAVDFLVPYWTGAQTWQFDEITDVDPFHEAAQSVRRAAAAFPDAGYDSVLTDLTAGQSAADVLRVELGFWPN